MDPRLPKFYQLKATTRENSDTFTLTVAQSGAFAFLPGQFNMLYVPGYGESAISISGDPLDPDHLVHTVRAVGGVTGALQRLYPGDWLGVRGPYGVPWPEPEAADAHVVIIAGGIGLAPLRPVIYRALARGQRLFIVYGARSPDTLIYSQELRAWSHHPRATCVVTVDRGDPDWHGNSGIVTKYIGQLGFDPQRARGYVCGPEVMIRFAARELVERGLPAEEVFVSLERQMKCGVGLCGHCQLGPHLLCRSGPVLAYPDAQLLINTREL